MFFIDSQKSFDTINHEVFQRKMAFSGFSNQSIIRFQSYLFNRSFPVNIKIKYSTTAKIDCIDYWVILRPLLFLLICEWYEAGCRLWLESIYTDDSCLPVQRRQRRKIKQSLNTHFLKI